MDHIECCAWYFDCMQKSIESLMLLLCLHLCFSHFIVSEWHIDRESLWAKRLPVDMFCWTNMIECRRSKKFSIVIIFSLKTPSRCHSLRIIATSFQCHSSHNMAPAWGASSSRSTDIVALRQGLQLEEDNECSMRSFSTLYRAILIGT
jgi:hypothetical protein